MKSIAFRILLSFTLLLGNVAVSFPASPVAPEDCIVCGHQCCCPEMCAPQIAKAKRRLTEECAVSAAQCSLGPVQSQSAMHREETSSAAKPRFSALGAVGLPNRSAETPFSALDKIFPNRHVRDVPFPPPRLSA